MSELSKGIANMGTKLRQMARQEEWAEIGARVFLLKPSDRAYKVGKAEYVLCLCSPTIDDTGPEHRERLRAGLIEGNVMALAAVGAALLQAGAKEG